MPEEGSALLSEEAQEGSRSQRYSASKSLQRVDDLDPLEEQLLEQGDEGGEGKH